MNLAVLVIKYYIGSFKVLSQYIFIISFLLDQLKTSPEYQIF